MGLIIGIHPMFNNGEVFDGGYDDMDFILTEDSIYLACENGELLKLEQDE